MAFWLAHKRDGQESDWIQRFDPRFWTVDFPRPMMASVVTTSADSLRVDLEFHHANALAGLIWDSSDRYDHPLLRYDTDFDYSRTTLRFRWRSGGVLPLDAVHGPTLTIEGRDASETPRTWYVRLWNYAVGSPDDAVVTLPFSTLAGGWAPSDPVWPHDIDRMFVSLAPPGYDPASASLLAQRADGWVELSEIVCAGDRPMLAIGDVLLPPHDLHMATAYDDSYNLTPARVLHNLRGLGYRGAIIHYVGMSHYYRLERQGGDALLVDATPQLCTPAESWHASYFALCAGQGYRPIASLSYELFAEHCPPTWQQRFADGSPALTGWVPPSALLSPAAHPDASGGDQPDPRSGQSDEDLDPDHAGGEVGPPWIADDEIFQNLSAEADPLQFIAGLDSAARELAIDIVGCEPDPQEPEDDQGGK